MIARGSLRFYRGDYASIVDKAKLFELFDEEETLQSFLIRFTLSNRNITAPLVGTQNADYLIANKWAADRGPLAQDVYQEARRRLSY